MKGKTPFMALSFDKFPEMTLVKIDLAKMASAAQRVCATKTLPTLEAKSTGSWRW
jgi:hypothetical protein